ncbi:MAG TPA: phytase [Actinomycetota bacterium]
MHRHVSRRPGALVLLACLIATTGLTAPASAVTLTTTAEADAFVLSSSPNGNRGRTSALKVRNDVKLSYIRFSVPGLPSGEVLSIATLRVFASSSARCTLGVDVLRAASDAWVESTITWTNQPGVTGPVLANDTWNSTGYRAFDVTSAVMAGEPVSFVLRHASGCSATADSTFHSREAVNRPQLVLQTGGETVAACADGADNDGDGQTDFPADPGCSDVTDTDETDVAPPPGVAQVRPWLETQPVDGQNDVADDTAIWVNPVEPSESLVLGTNKNDTGVGGLHVFDLAGQRLSKVSHGTRMNGVDVRDGFVLGAQTIPLVAVTNKTVNAIDFFSIDPATGGLTHVGSVASAVPGIAGMCMYHSGDSGAFYAIATHGGNGTFEQFALDGSSGVVTAQLVRTVDARSTIEGCVADDELGHLYVSQETKGVWRYAAEPTAGSSRTLVDDDSPTGHLVADVEGLAIWSGPSGTGWLVVSSQGESTFAVYSRQLPNTYQGEFDITTTETIDDTNFTDGIDVTSAALPSPFSGGLLVAHDHSPEGPHASNFKYVRWQDIATALGL